MSSFVHAAKKIRDILIYGDGLTQGLDDTILRAEVFVLSVHYHGSNNFLFVNTTKKSLFKVIDSEIKYYTLCLGNISKDFTLKLLYLTYNLVMTRITRSAIIVKLNTEAVKMIKSNILYLKVFLYFHKFG